MLVIALLEAKGDPLLLAVGPGLPREGGIMTAPTYEGLWEAFFSIGLESTAFAPGVSLTDKVNLLIRRGYSFLIRTDKGALAVFSRKPMVWDSPYVMEFFSIKPADEIVWSKIFPGPGAIMPADAVLNGENAEAETSVLIIFGGVENPPSGTITHPNRITSKELSAGIKEGHRYALKHAGTDRIVIITPDADRPEVEFTPAEIAAMKSIFGINGSTKVQWYLGSLDPAASSIVSASEAWGTSRTKVLGSGPSNLRSTVRGALGRLPVPGTGGT